MFIQRMQSSTQANQNKATSSTNSFKLVMNYTQVSIQLCLKNVENFNIV